MGGYHKSTAVYIVAWRKYVANVQDLIGATRMWPWAIREAFMRCNMSNQDRFKVIWFMLSNGLDEHVMWQRFHNFEPYDAAAHRQIEWLFKEFKRNPNRYKTWDIMAGRSQ